MYSLSYAPLFCMRLQKAHTKEGSYSCFPMRLQKAFTKEGSVSRPLYAMLFILYGEGINSIAYKGLLTEPSPHRKTPHPMRRRDK